jgi:SpoVK/Ycf46/Vps4 family AAA+-type ATPase
MPEATTIKSAVSSLVRRIVVWIVIVMISTLTSKIARMFHDKIEGMPSSMMPRGKTPHRGIGPLTSHEKIIMGTIVDPSSMSETLSDVGGLEKIKEDIWLNVVTPLKNPSAFFCKDLSCLLPSRGLLFVGPPGTGKTMLARAIAKECGVPFIAPTLSTLENKYFGESSKMLVALFSVARKLQPCIVFLDEVDGMVKERSGEDQACVYSFKTEFLTHLDGIGSKDTDSFIVIGCTNSSRSLDAALKRRLPKVYMIDKPSESDRVNIVSIVLGKEPKKVSEQTVRWIARMTPGFTGSDIRELYKSASSIRYRQVMANSNFQQAVRTGSASAIKGFLKPITRPMWKEAIEVALKQRTEATLDYCSRPSGELETMLRMLRGGAGPPIPAEK